MKTILSNWIGTSKASSSEGMVSKRPSPELGKNPASAGEQSFMGMMMGFLGMQGEENASTTGSTPGHTLADKQASTSTSTDGSTQPDGSASAIAGTMQAADETGLTPSQQPIVTADTPSSTVPVDGNTHSDGETAKLQHAPADGASGSVQESTSGAGNTSASLKTTSTSAEDVKQATESNEQTKGTSTNSTNVTATEGTMPSQAPASGTSVNGTTDANGQGMSSVTETSRANAGSTAPETTVKSAQGLQNQVPADSGPTATAASVAGTSQSQEANQQNINHAGSGGQQSTTPQKPSTPGMEPPVKDTATTSAPQSTEKTSGTSAFSSATAQPKETPKTKHTGTGTKQTPLPSQDHVSGGNQTKEAAQPLSDSLKKSDASSAKFNLKPQPEGDTRQPLQASRPRMAEVQQLAGNGSATKPNMAKSETTNASLAPGAFSASDMEETQMQFQTDMSGQEQSDDTGSQSDDVRFDSIKSAQLQETSGRRSFSRQLAQVTRQQFKQIQESARSNEAWKHHRFTLKDGSSINISARNTDGALQLQLNAGNSELSKIIQQHLPEIQQHVEQELNIKINLQMQQFEGQQPKQDSGQSQQASSAPSSSSGMGSGQGKSTTGSNRRQVRYFGFNQNEWTA